MDVYLIPVGAARYELYCEEPDLEAAERVAEIPTGPLAGLWQRFRSALAHAERQRDLDLDASRASMASDQTSWRQRMTARFLRWIAEAIAEQRLLWHLRRQSEATASFPDDVSGPEAMDAIRGMLRRDADRHRRWLVVDALALLVTGLIAILPGPNLIAYYFAFRLVGHYLSLRGARQGLNRVRWRERPCPPLTRLREAIDLAPHDRERRVEEIARQLHLSRLPGFFKRTAIRTA